MEGSADDDSENTQAQAGLDGGNIGMMLRHVISSVIT